MYHWPLNAIDIPIYTVYCYDSRIKCRARLILKDRKLLEN